MLEEVHRERDGRLLLGRNLISDEERHLVLPRDCQLHPVTDRIIEWMLDGGGVDDYEALIEGGLVFTEDDA